MHIPQSSSGIISFKNFFFLRFMPEIYFFLFILKIFVFYFTKLYFIMGNGLMWKILFDPNFWQHIRFIAIHRDRAA